MTEIASPDDVVAFWKAAGPDRWFAKDDGFDAEFRRRFEAQHFAAARRELDAWAGSAEGSLGLCLLLDQFPRNVFRNTGHAFATDPLARWFARAALEAGHDQALEPALRPFIYLPFQHHEDLADQQKALSLFEAIPGGDPKWARHHLKVIERFGRFPHRNPALGRETTAAERAFLEEDGFRG